MIICQSGNLTKWKFDEVKIWQTTTTNNKTYNLTMQNFDIEIYFYELKYFCVWPLQKFRNSIAAHFLVPSVEISNTLFKVNTVVFKGANVINRFFSELNFSLVRGDFIDVLIFNQLLNCPNRIIWPKTNVTENQSHENNKGIKNQSDQKLKNNQPNLQKI